MNIHQTQHRSPRVIVLRFGALGDVVLLTALFRAIHEHFDSVTIDVLTKNRFVPLLETHPALNHVYGLGSEATPKRIAERIGLANYNVMIDAHGSLRSRLLKRVAPGEWRTIRKHRLLRFQNIWLKKDIAIPSVARRYLDTVSNLGIKPTDVTPDLHVTDVDRAKAEEIVADKYVVLAVGAQHHTKRWPVRHWRALAEDLISRGIKCVGLGVGSESSTLEGMDIIGAYDLPIRTSVALVANAKAVVAHDSGMMHVATAVNVPVVPIYGPTDPRLGYGPPGTGTTTVSIPLACRPCSVFGGPHCPAGHHRCMEDLLPTRVLAALENVI